MHRVTTLAQNGGKFSQNATRHSPRHNASPKWKQIFSECTASQPASQRQPKTEENFLRMHRVTDRVTSPVQNGSKFSQKALRHSPRHIASPKWRQIFSECIIKLLKLVLLKLLLPPETNPTSGGQSVSIIEEVPIVPKSARSNSGHTANGCGRSFSFGTGRTSQTSLRVYNSYSKLAGNRRNSRKYFGTIRSGNITPLGNRSLPLLVGSLFASCLLHCA